ncbi:neural proliferation differentiation and control 1, partial [Pelobates cultripes]
DHCRTIDCTLQMREHCPSGSDVCGPCIQGLTESSDGKCLTTSPKAYESSALRVGIKRDQLHTDCLAYSMKQKA